MNCPYCDSPLSPAAEECERCHLSFTKACELFGVVPRIGSDVYDSTMTLSGTDSVAIQRRMNRLQRKFPELALRVIIHSFPQPHPLKTYAFWLFNAAELSSVSNRGSRNHTILILIDPSRMETAIMPGYGLESQLSPDKMDSILGEATGFFRSRDFVGGIEMILNQLGEHFETVAEPAANWQIALSEF